MKKKTKDWCWIANPGLEVDGPHSFLDWDQRKGETQSSLTLGSAVNIQPSHFDPTTSTGMEATVQMDEMIRIRQDERCGVNEMNGDVYVDGLGDVNAFEESGCGLLHGGDGYEYDGQAVGRRDVVTGRRWALDSDRLRSRKGGKIHGLAREVVG